LGESNSLLTGVGSAGQNLSRVNRLGRVFVTFDFAELCLNRV
jgi:hypothetical protein